MTEITSKILKFGMVEWQTMQFIQIIDFKIWTEKGAKKLNESLLKFQFADPFKVWESDGIIYCLDGKHRVDKLKEFKLSGNSVPKELPAVFIDCKSKQEASELVLIYSSYYAKITTEKMVDFVKLYELNFDEIKQIAELPGLDLDILNDRFLPMPADFIGLNKNKPITLTITFKEKQHIEDAVPKIRELLTNYEGALFSVSAGEL
jgi:hypothetical protein